jgi:hypothetical protein
MTLLFRWGGQSADFPNLPMPPAIRLHILQDWRTLPFRALSVCEKGARSAQKN